MSYMLRLLDDGDTEVRTITVEPLPNAQNYPAVGQMIDDWKIIAIVRRSDAEHWARVERLKP